MRYRFKPSANANDGIGHQIGPELSSHSGGSFLVGRWPVALKHRHPDSAVALGGIGASHCPRLLQAYDLDVLNGRIDGCGRQRRSRIKWRSRDRILITRAVECLEWIFKTYAPCQENRAEKYRSRQRHVFHKRLSFIYVSDRDASL